MLKRVLIILCLIFTPLLSFADTQDSSLKPGYPEGFYDDIDPNSLDKEDEDFYIQKKEIDNYREENTGTGNLHELKDDEILITPNKQTGNKNYAKIYNDLEPAKFSYLHNIDPEQYYDTKDAAWSVYPLLRLNAPIYFKNITVEPGYYLLTPREHNGKWYMLFKQNGLVVHIIPVYNRDYTPEKFYDEHIPKPKLTGSQKVHMGTLKALGKFKSTKRKEPVKSYLEVNDLENYFISIVIYYGNHKYSTLFRTIRL